MLRIFLSPLDAQNVTVSGPPALKLYAGTAKPNGTILHPNAGELFLSASGSVWVNTNGVAIVLIWFALGMFTVNNVGYVLATSVS